MAAISPRAFISTLARFSPIAAVCLWALPAHAQNLVTDGTFDDGTASPWWGEGEKRAIR